MVALHVADRDQLLLVEHAERISASRAVNVPSVTGIGCTKPRFERVGDHAVLGLDLHDDRQVALVGVGPRLELLEAPHEGEARGAVVDLLDVEHLEAGLLHHGVDRLEAEERLGLGRGVATTVRVLEHVELHGPQAEVELLGEGGVRVLDRGGERRGGCAVIAARRASSPSRW